MPASVSLLHGILVLVHLLLKGILWLDKKRKHAKLVPPKPLPSGKRLHYLQHVPNEGLGYIGQWALRHNHTVTVTRLYADDPFPALDDFDFLVILGGPMNIYDEKHHPWLAYEKAFIRIVIESGKPMLALCLGSQLVADALGAKVTRNKHNEIGWFPVTWTDEACARFPNLPNPLTVFHWHEDTFSIPPNAILLASSEACPHQGYAYGESIIALQFHPEVMPMSLYEMLGQEDFPATCYTQKRRAILDEWGYFNPTRNFLFALLDTHFGGK
jgi:GMP synthase-like glutamine amidotransferase